MDVSGLRAVANVALSTKNEKQTRGTGPGYFYEMWSGEGGYRGVVNLGVNGYRVLDETCRLVTRRLEPESTGQEQTVPGLGHDKRTDRSGRLTFQLIKRRKLSNNPLHTYHREMGSVGQDLGQGKGFL